MVIRHESPNSLANAGFEDEGIVSMNDIPKWETIDRATNNSTVRLADSGAYDGKKYLVLTTQSSDSIVVGQKLVLESDTLYRLSGFVKIDGVVFDGDAGGAYLNVRIGDEYHW
jgi:hypothetical protein